MQLSGGFLWEGVDGQFISHSVSSPRCMGTGDHNAGGKSCDGLASHPGGSSNIPSCFMLQKPELSIGLMGLLARMQTLPSWCWIS